MAVLQRTTLPWPIGALGYVSPHAAQCIHASIVMQKYGNSVCLGDNYIKLCPVLWTEVIVICCRAVNHASPARVDRPASPLVGHSPSNGTVAATATESPVSYEQLKAKYKRAKRLLQVSYATPAAMHFGHCLLVYVLTPSKHMAALVQAQLNENDTLKQQLMVENKKTAVLEARAAAIGSPADTAQLLATTQVRATAYIDVVPIQRNQDCC